MLWRTSDGRSEKNGVCAPRKDRFHHHHPACLHLQFLRPFVSDSTFLFQARVVPETDAGLVEYFLDTEAQEIEFEIARLRPRSVIFRLLIL